jgi:hypothetical protein
VAAIARDIGVSTQELEFITSKGPNAAAELPKLLRALGVDPQKLPSDRRTTIRDLQRLCITCGHKAQCRHELASGTADVGRMVFSIGLSRIDLNQSSYGSS